jgi:NOL1/NOP2/fmu family ribosome biogenesis protein
MKLITSQEKKKIVEQLNKQYGINEIPFQLIRFGEEKLRIFSGNLTKEQLMAFDKELRIENCGLYFAKKEIEGIRLTFDGIQIFKNQILKNILELTEQQANDWLRGNEIQIKAEKGFKILKYNNEFIGCGKSTGIKITNYMPKERRIK